MALGVGSLLSAPSAVLGGADPLGGAATSSAYSDSVTGAATISGDFVTDGSRGVPWGLLAVTGVAVVAFVAMTRR